MLKNITRIVQLIQGLGKDDGFSVYLFFIHIFIACDTVMLTVYHFALLYKLASFDIHIAVDVVKCLMHL